MTDLMQEDFEDIETCARQGRRPREDGPYRVLIGDQHLAYQAFVTIAPLTTGRALLELAELQPFEDYVIFAVHADGVLTEVRPDEPFDLRSRGAEKFLAFRSDRIFRFFLDGREYEWGAGRIEETVLRELAHVPADQAFEIERHHGADRIVNDGDEIRLDGEGVERLRTAPRPMVTVKINTKPVELPRGWNTGAEIKAAAIAAGVKIKPDFILHLEGADGVDLVIGDTDRLFIRGGECFDALDNHEDS